MDWIDIGLHAMGAIAITGFTGLLHPGGALALNTAFWTIRELVQHENNPMAVFTHPQSLLEWVVPVVLGLGVYLVLKKYGPANA